MRHDRSSGPQVNEEIRKRNIRTWSPKVPSANTDTESAIAISC